MLPARDAELRLDIDAGAKRPSLARIVLLLDRAGYRPVAWWERRSPSGRGWHIGITVDPRPRSAVEVVALQALCGSDPFREAVTLLRARCYHKTPAFARSWYNVLYDPAPAARAKRLQVPWRKLGVSTHTRRRK